MAERVLGNRWRRWRRVGGQGRGSGFRRGVGGLSQSLSTGVVVVAVVVAVAAVLAAEAPKPDPPVVVRAGPEAIRER